jgi:Tfp pilus assembly protein PilF
MVPAIVLPLLARCHLSRLRRHLPRLRAAWRALRPRQLPAAAGCACRVPAAPPGRWLGLASVIAVVAGLARGVVAAPYLPQSGAQVVETLPRRGDAQPQELQSLRAQLRAAPGDAAVATSIARRYIALGRSESDPRYFGYAQAALSPWWTAAAPPPQVRLLRATLLQSAHQFAPALADLQAVTATDPSNAQAWLTRATVQTVRGDYAGATASCARLPALAGHLIASTCLAAARANTGQLASSARLLLAVLARGADDEPADVRVWALTLLAELCARRGDAQADARFRAALALAPRDSYLLGAYADYLLDHGRAGEAERLLAPFQRIDSLLLRHALALQQQGRARELAAARAELQARFDAAALRGDSVHLREQSRFTLHLLGDARSALALARRNWDTQKELPDLRLLLESARAAGDAASVAQAAAWVRQHGLEDVAVARLLKGGA